MRVWAREARFDRFVENDKKPLVVSKHVRRLEEVGGRRKEVVPADGEGEKNVRLGVGVEADLEKGRRGEGEKIVRVGKVEVPVMDEVSRKREDRKVRESPVLMLKEEERGPRVEKKVNVTFLDVDEDGKVTRVSESEMDRWEKPSKAVALEGKTTNIVKLHYQSDKEDRDWASAGIVAMVTSGESILSIQQRVEDAGFINKGVIPMGGDRVFIRGSNNNNIWEVYNLAKDFFGMFLSRCLGTCLWDTGSCMEY